MPACWLTATGVLAIYLAQSIARRAGAVDAAASIVGDLAVIALIAIAARVARVSWRGLGVTWPRPRFVVAGLLVGCSAWYVDLRLVMWLAPPDPGSERLQAVVEQSALLPTLVGFALLPALGEELLFRGVLARALAARTRAPLAIAGSAVVFAAYHVVPSQALANLVFGVLLALLALRAASLLPAALAHLLNNTCAIAISRDEASLGTWITNHPGAMLAGSTAVLAGGVALAWRGTS